MTIAWWQVIVITLAVWVPLRVAAGLWRRR